MSSSSEESTRAAPGRPSRRWWWLVAALVLPPLVIRGLLLEVYAIQSDSMTPTFRAGDQLLALQPLLDPRDTRRWDVVILDRSVDAGVSEGVDAVIKRVVGLSGELVRILDGDVYAKPVELPGELRLVRKPDEVVMGLLVPVHAADGLVEPWVVLPAAARRDLRQGTRLDGTAEPVRVVYQAAVEDGQLGRPGENAVGDTALELLLGAVEPGPSAGPALLTLTVREGADLFQAQLPLGAAGPATLHHRNAVPDAPVDRVDTLPGLGEGTRVLIWNVDDGVRVFVDDRLVLSHDYAAGERRTPGSELHNDPRIELSGAALVLSQVVVARDLHFTAQGDYGTDPGLGLSPARVPPDGLFVLGDSSTESRDSRYFGPVPKSRLRGRPLALYRPWPRAAWLGPAGTVGARSPGRRLDDARE